LYYAHFDDPDTPLKESVEAMSSLVDAGKVRAIGISNYSADRIHEWLQICDKAGFHRPVALQPQYSLVERDIEEKLLPTARAERLGVMPYYALARGFLTGKYNGNASIDSPRASAAAG
ncbi:MAG: aldo/keto reductase, partial [Solirubrobacterales bacterium]|nr:aldo/keto reductase [Solirubrobacterales bacterium]